MDLNHLPGPLTPPPQPRMLVSELLGALALRLAHTPQTFGDVVKTLGDRTFGLLLLFVAVINLIPGLSLVFGPVMALIGLQLAVGMRRPWLPRRITEIELPQAGTIAILERFNPWLLKLEKLLKPRWHWTEAPLVDNLLGFLVGLLGVIVTIPIPLSNAAPSLVVGTIGIGLAARDGMVQIIGLVIGSITAWFLGGLAWLVLTKLF